MTPPLHHEFIAELLRDHFSTEAFDAGLKSPDLRGVGGGSPDPESRMSQRRINRQEQHRHVRAALRALPVAQAELLELAYGCHLRDRDDDTGARARKAKRQGPEEQGWRIRFRKAFDARECPVVLASPIARAAFEAHLESLRLIAKDAQQDLPRRVEAASAPGVRYDDTNAQRARLRVTLPAHAASTAELLSRTTESGFVEWLLVSASAVQRDRFLAEALSLLGSAREAFGTAYVVACASSGQRTKRPAPQKRARRSNQDRVRVLAFHAVDGQEI